MPTQSNTPVKKEGGAVEAPRSSGAEVDAFLARNRQPTWDLALGLQADMFRAVKEADLMCS